MKTWTATSMLANNLRPRTESPQRPFAALLQARVRRGGAPAPALRARAPADDVFQTASRDYMGRLPRSRGGSWPRRSVESRLWVRRRASLGHARSTRSLHQLPRLCPRLHFEGQADGSGGGIAKSAGASLVAVLIAHPVIYASVIVNVRMVVLDGLCGEASVLYRVRWIVEPPNRVVRR